MACSWCTVELQVEDGGCAKVLTVEHSNNNQIK